MEHYPQQHLVAENIHKQNEETKTFESRAWHKIYASVLASNRVLTVTVTKFLKLLIDSESTRIIRNKVRGNWG